jgi:polyketide cyclase/dehydrase/lipid transport protein
MLLGDFQALTLQARRDARCHESRATRLAQSGISCIIDGVHFVVTETLQASPRGVFDVISDPRRRMEWQSSLLSVEVSTSGPPRQGMRWREVTQGWVSFDMEITRFERPALWSEHGRGWLADATLDVAIEPLGEATRVNVAVEIAFKGPFKALAPLVRRFMPGALAADLQRLAALARQLDSTQPAG